MFVEILVRETSNNVLNNAYCFKFLPSLEILSWFSFLALFLYCVDKSVKLECSINTEEFTVFVPMN